MVQKPLESYSLCFCQGKASGRKKQRAGLKMSNAAAKLEKMLVRGNIQIFKEKQGDTRKSQMRRASAPAGWFWTTSESRYPTGLNPHDCGGQMFLV